jgi:hypothetical protein
MTQYLMTGEGPKELKDYYFPKTGGTDEHGDPVRIAYPSYMKDLYHYKTDPGQTVKNKLHPLLGLVADMLQNEDYYGTKIRNEDDPFIQQLKDMATYTAKQAEPLGFRNIERNVNVEGKVTAKGLLPFIGITPVPRSVNESAAEKLAYRYIDDMMPQGSRTKAQADESRLKWEIRRDILRTGNNNPPSLQAAVKSGKLTSREVANIHRRVQQGPLEAAMAHLPLEIAIKVYDTATPDERKEIADEMVKKITNFQKNASGEDLARMRPEIKRLLESGLRIGPQKAPPPPHLSKPPALPRVGAR